jgi:hypothetical protein
MEFGYGDSKKRMLEDAKKKVEVDEDDIMFFIDIKCNDESDAKDFKEDL